MSVNLEKFIREVPDFPKKGIGFKDITTLLKDAEGFKLAVDQLAEQLKDIKIDAIAVIESRGFPFGSALAYKLGTGLLLVRKPGKLPAPTIRQEYALEYGTDALEIHQDAISAGTEHSDRGRLAGHRWNGFGSGQIGETTGGQGGRHRLRGGTGLS